MNEVSYTFIERTMSWRWCFIEVSLRQVYVGPLIEGDWTGSQTRASRRRCCPFVFSSVEVQL